MMAELSPLQKAIRDLEDVDKEVILALCRALPGLRDSNVVVELRSIRHEGWRLSAVYRELLGAEQGTPSYRKFQIRQKRDERP